jgi:ABC-type multidrug transport system ATPase subunit/pSer/pThr/pTyr-binding forkhead associated (FHA) protein
MKIVLVEDQPNSPEKSFQQDVIRIGRDAEDCQIVFPREQYPMVSRQHAEIRHQNGGWVLVDKNSTYGTFLNKRKIDKPEVIQVGSTIQIGAEGPNLIVIWLEVGGTSIPAVKPVVTPAESQKKIPTFIPSKEVEVPSELPSIPPVAVVLPNQDPVPSKALPNETAVQFEFVGKQGIPPFKMNKDQIWIGRDPNCDIVMETTLAMVSRRHAQITKQNGQLTAIDNNSFNGTLVNGQRISAPTPLYHGDEIQLGSCGPTLKLNQPQQIAPKGDNLAGQRAVPESQKAILQNSIMLDAPKTMVINDVRPAKPADSSSEPQLLMSLAFGNKSELSIGRTGKNDIQLDGLQISNRHARLVKNNGIWIEDLNSTNGVYLNGERVSRQVLTPDDSVQIGSFQIRIDLSGTVGVFDTRSKTRIDCVKITKEIKNRTGGGKIRLLDEVSLSIQPNEFIGLLGPSGAGKSTLMDALNGMRPATGGSVRINNLDLYAHLDSLKQAIGYVPQDDIIHRELSVYRTLYYVAKLRLSRDVSNKEIDQIINEVLDVTGLAERRDIPVSQLSGGQRKRVSIAVELITKPSVIFLDEPTSGLDPSTEEKIMKLFRQIAESGRTVILTTHAMENVKLFDKIVVLMRGKLVFYGKPEEALAHVGAKSFKELYDKLEEPVEREVKKLNESQRAAITEQVAEDWKQKFSKTPQYKKNVYEPLKQIAEAQSSGLQKKRRLGLVGAIRQWLILSRRYWEVLFRDKFNLFILLAQAPIIALLTFIVMDAKQPRDFIYFILAIVSIWFGTSVSSREIIRERPVFQRERMVNLGLLPYLGSKLFVLGIIVAIQCLMLFIPLKIFDLAQLMKMPGDLGGLPQFWAMLLTAGVGVALGLLISALVKTSEMAASLIPLILIPQILFSGLVGVPSGVSKVIGLTMPVTWSFDTMKRFSTLDTLQKDGALPNGKTKGSGLYESIKEQNKEVVNDAKNKLDEYKKELEESIRTSQGSPPTLKEPPEPGDAVNVPDDLSGYVNFLHPWMHEILNQLVLMIMFYMLVIATLIILRWQDIS